MHKKKQVYDFVYLTNTPSFYKLNLCEAIARKGYKLLLVLYGYGAEAVNTTLSDKSSWSFNYHFIYTGNSNDRNRFKTFLSLIRLMRSIRAKKLLYAGWFTPEYDAYSMLSPKRRNVVISESSSWDISLSGYKGFLKRIFIKRMSSALPSGLPHIDFFQQIGFKGLIHPTGSVGLLAKKPRTLRPFTSPPKLRYICVARLIDCKNLRFLIEQFNINGLPLTIVGQGELETELKAMAKPNIKFTGFIENDKIGEVYQAHDVFILPSTYEPWGLVVEEALYWGLPVIVSNRVGAGPDMVRDLHTGEIFDIEDPESLGKAIREISANYTKYRKAILAIDWDERERLQIQAYINLLK